MKIASSRQLVVSSIGSFMKRISLIILSGARTFYSFAQDTTRQKIAIFAPLYLDSAFNDTSGYRYARNVFPKFMSPGIEFYEGIQLALDSMNKDKIPLEVFVYDTRSATESLSDQLEKAALDSVGLIIAHCSSNEVKAFADAGLRSSIPVINVNMPNDGGVTENPYYVMLNPTLRTQCQGIYRYIQKYYSIDDIVVFRKKGQLEDKIKLYFDEAAKTTGSVRLPIRWVELNDSFTIAHLKRYLDTSQQTVCIAGSLDENFGKRLVQQLVVLRKQNYKATVIGMPTWDDIPLTKSEFKGVEVTYSTPFYNARLDKISTGIITYFNRFIFARPSDLVFRGYEMMWRYAHLLNLFGKELSSNITSKQFRVFIDYDIQPVMNKQNSTVDYYENRKLYFLRWEDGVIKAVY
jgi:hypothetical protein